MFIKRKMWRIISLFPLLLYLAYRLFALICWVSLFALFFVIFSSLSLGKGAGGYFPFRGYMKVKCIYTKLKGKLQRSNYSCITYTNTCMHDSNSSSQLDVQFLSDISHDLYSIGQEFQSLTQVVCLGRSGSCRERQFFCQLVPIL